MRETIEKTIHGRSYMIQQLGGSWKQRLKIRQAKNQKQFRDLLPGIELPKPGTKAWEEFRASEKYIDLAIDMAASQTEEDIQYTKELIQASVVAPKGISSKSEEDSNGFEDGYEAYFSKFSEDIVPLEEAINEINLGKAEKKTQSTRESETTNTDQP